MRESRKLEIKRSISTTYLKTVSAFANYGTGEIKFGIDDHGNDSAGFGRVQEARDRQSVDNV